MLEWIASGMIGYVNRGWDVGNRGGSYVSSLGLKEVHVFFVFGFIFNVYLFLRETEGEGGGPERDKNTESKARSRLWPVSTQTDGGLELTSHDHKWLRHQTTQGS